MAIDFWRVAIDYGWVVINYRGGSVVINLMLWGEVVMVQLIWGVEGVDYSSFVGGGAVVILFSI